MNEGLFSSASSEWFTPDDLYETLDAEFGFSLDPCATSANARCRRFYTKAEDGLSRSWDDITFMNPPYGREIGAWVHKAWQESSTQTVVCLIPARTDTVYWHAYVMRAAEVRFIRGRLRFGAGSGQVTNSAPFPSAVTVFRPGHHGHPIFSSIDRHGTALGRAAMDLSA